MDKGFAFTSPVPETDLHFVILTYGTAPKLFAGVTMERREGRLRQLGLVSDLFLEEKPDVLSDVQRALYDRYRHLNHQAVPEETLDALYAEAVVAGMKWETDHYRQCGLMNEMLHEVMRGLSEQ